MLKSLDRVLTCRLWWFGCKHSQQTDYLPRLSYLFFQAKTASTCIKATVHLRGHQEIKTITAHSALAVANINILGGRELCVSHDLKNTEKSVSASMKLTVYCEDSVSSKSPAVVLT